MNVCFEVIVTDCHMPPKDRVYPCVQEMYLRVEVQEVPASGPQLNTLTSSWAPHPSTVATPKARVLHLRLPPVPAVGGTRQAFWTQRYKVGDLLRPTAEGPSG